MFSNDKFVKCDDCNGEGWIFRFPYYATKMPKEVKCTCETCNGKGKLAIVPNGYNLIYEGDLKNV